MKKIIFRADGNSETGLGHLYRLFALVEIYKKRFEFIFLTKENTTLNIIPSTYPTEIIPNAILLEDEPKWINENYPSNHYMIIADGYQFKSQYQKDIKKFGYRLFYIDDLANEHMYADVVINHSLFIKISDYKKESYTALAFGTHYAVLRPGFLEAAKRSRVVNTIDTVFVCFGGADPYNLTIKAIDALLNISEIKKIHVVIGGAYLHQEVFEIEKMYAQVIIHQNISEPELVAVMNQCNFGIAPASNILYELCAVKMPLLSGYYVDNQRNIYNGSLECGIIFPAGNMELYSAADFEAKIKDVLNEKNYQKYIDAQSKLFDSKIEERFLNLIPQLNYRKASNDDMLLLFNWSNDPLSRSNSYFTEPIPLETHKTWFEKKINDKNSIIYIAEVDKKPAGMIRYDIGEKDTVVGVSVTNEFRGKGYASDFLMDTAQLYFREFSKPILAYIKQNNHASIKSFEKANYKKLRSEIVHGSESFVYELKNN